jgi:endonuclease III related protein
VFGWTKNVIALPSGKLGNSMVDAKTRRDVVALYRALFETWGPQEWWPASTQFEVVVGAFLTQNTAWTNVEKALIQLRQARTLSVSGIRNTPLADLEQLVRPAGYFRQKAQRLKNFIWYLDGRHRGSLQRMFATPTAVLRQELLALNGVGPETADAILLYAGGHPVFVVDAYTRRLFERHRILKFDANYEVIRELVEAAFIEAQRGGTLPPVKPTQVQIAWRNSPFGGASAELARAYNEFHALLVTAGKRHCLKKAAECDACPLKPFMNL